MLKRKAVANLAVSGALVRKLIVNRADMLYVAVNISIVQQLDYCWPRCFCGIIHKQFGPRVTLPSLVLRSLQRAPRRYSTSHLSRN
jgi:hypothetical protein